MDILKLIDEAIVKDSEKQHRPYVGASMIGHACLRYIFLNLIGQEGLPFSAKQLRTFEIGKQLEKMVLSYISKAGFKLRPSMYNNCQDDLIPYFKGTCDGILQLSDTTDCILELKTAKNSEYQKFVNNGLKAWNQQYYAQCHAYMGMKKINRCLFVVINKDTSDWAGEWIDFDEILYAELQSKAAYILNQTEVPPKINENPCYWICQNCKFKDYCHKPKQEDVIKEWIEEL